MSMFKITAQLSDRILSICLSICLGWSAPAGAAISPSDQKILSEIVAAYNESESIASFLDKQKSHMGSAEYDFFKSKLRSSLERPRMSLGTNGVVSIEHAGEIVRIQAVSSRPLAFRLNNKPLKLPSQPTIQDLWRELNSLLPKKTGQNFIIEAVLPKANAHPIGLAVIVAGAVIYGVHKYSNCRQLKNDLEKCSPYIHKLEMKIIENTQPSDEEKNKLLEDMKEFKNVVTEQKRQTWTCEDDIERLETCSDKIEENALKVGIPVKGHVDTSLTPAGKANK